MTYDEAKVILKDDIGPTGGLCNSSWFLEWEPRRGDIATLDGMFSVEDLEAIAAYMKGTLETKGTKSNGQ